MNFVQVANELKENLDKSTVLRRILIMLQHDETKAYEAWFMDEMPIAIIQIITDSFYLVNTSGFTKETESEIKMCLDLLCIMVKNQDVKDNFLAAQMDVYFYPFLMFDVGEELRISILMLFLILFRQGLPENVKGSELIPLLLKIVDDGSEKLQMLALETLEAILLGSNLDYAVQTIDRYQAIDVVLCAYLKKSVLSNNIRFVKTILKIYCRLSDKPNVYQKLKEKLPEGINYNEIYKMCEKDQEVDDLRLRIVQIHQ